MAGVIDDFELGLAGISDGVERGVAGMVRAVGLDATADALTSDATTAAQLYVEQTPGLSNEAINSAVNAETNGKILGAAASKTVDDIGKAAKKAGFGALTALEWGLGIGAGVVVLFGAWKAYRVLA